MTTQERIEMAEEALARLLEWPPRIDSKSSVVLGVDVAMIGVLTSFAPAFQTWTPAMTICAALSALLLVAVLVFVHLSSYPGISRPEDSLLFFGAIAKRKSAEYREAFLNQSAETYLNDLLEQCHRNALIVDRKFAYLRWAFRALLVAVVPWAITLYLFKAV